MNWTVMDDLIISELAKIPTDIQNLIIKFISSDYGKLEAIEKAIELIDNEEKTTRDPSTCTVYRTLNNTYFIMYTNDIDYKEKFCMLHKNSILGNCACRIYNSEQIFEEYLSYFGNRYTWSIDDKD